MPLWPIKFDQIIFINWLDIEIPGQYQPDHLSGWRNREVYHYIRSHDWTARMFEAPIKMENVRFSLG